MLRLFVLLRLPALLIGAALFAKALGDLLAQALINTAYSHGAAKLLIESWQILLFRQRELPWVLLGGGGLAAALSLLDGRRWLAGAALALLLSAGLGPWHSPWVLALYGALFLAAGAPAGRLAGRRWTRWVAWVPGAELLLPSVVSAGLGFSRRRAHQGLVFLGGAALGGLWLAADSAASYEHFRAAMAQWPAALTDPRVTILDRMPEWARADFHGVDIVGEHAVVVAEDRTLLRAYPLGVEPPFTEAQVPSYKLSERWDGVVRAATLDSETDLATGKTWVLDGPSRVRELQWTGQEWVSLRVEDFPFHLQYTYLRYDAGRERLLITTVQASERAPRVVVQVGAPGLGWFKVRPLKADGGAVPVLREIAWIPEINRLVAAPDFGDRLYLVDVDSGHTEPWLEVPTLDGKMEWVPQLGLLFLAIPNRPELWAIDPVKGEVVRRIPTQPGVRSVAVDPDRGLLVTASVVTGAVLVQDLETGDYVDHFRTVMPMVREIKLHVGRGEAVLSTWTVLYKIPYADRTDG